MSIQASITYGITIASKAIIQARSAPHDTISDIETASDIALVISQAASRLQKFKDNGFSVPAYLDTTMPRCVYEDDLC
jgi:hypothetical protein